MPFLTSYFRHRPERPLSKNQPKEITLHKHCYLLTKRLLLTIQISNMLKPYDMVNFVLAANAAFHDIAEWQHTLKQSIFVQSSQSDAGLDVWKTMLSSGFSSGQPYQWLDNLRQMKLLVRILPRAGFELMKGADYIETLMSLYLTEGKPVQTVLTEHVYRSLLSLVSPKRISTSTLLDQLYLLKSES